MSIISSLQATSLETGLFVQPTRVEPAINVNGAKTLGLDLPLGLIRADEVIE
jgi:hypothetical protein